MRSSHVRPACPVVSISAMCATRAHTGIEVEDVAVATVRFASGAVGLIEASTAVFPGFAARIEVTGTAGTVVVEDGVVKLLNIEEAPGKADLSSAAHLLAQI